MFEPKRLPPSRRNKKQVIAHLSPDIVEAVHKKRVRSNLTAQEIIAEAVNAAVQEFGRTDTILSVRRDRVVNRRKGLAVIQSADKAPPCRTGKRRLAGWFDTTEVDALQAFCAEVGIKTENLVELGLKKNLAEDIKAA